MLDKLVTGSGRWDRVDFVENMYANIAADVIVVAVVVVLVLLFRPNAPRIVEAVIEAS